MNAPDSPPFDLNAAIEQAKSQLEQNQIAAAITSYTQLIGVAQDNFSINVGLAVALTAGGRFNDATDILEYALERWPDHPDLLFVLADNQHQQGRIKTAENLYRHCLSQHPNHLPSRQNLGYLLYQTCRFQEAALAHADTIKLHPNHSPSWRDLGQSLVAGGLTEAGFNILQEANQRFPNDRETRFAMGLAALRLNHWKIGWEAYEARWLPGELEQRIPAGCSRWEGQSIPAGRTLHILREQGFGDNLLFARYLHLLPALATRISYVCHPALVSLFKHSFPNIDVSSQLKAQTGDVCLPIGSLPRMLLSIAPAPPKQTPYLEPSMDACSPQLLAALNQLSKPDHPLLAITWRGSQKDQLAERSTALDNLRQAIPAEVRHGKHMISLQKDPSPQEIEEMQTYGITDFSPLMEDFNATAMILARTDCLISIDTAIVHLAGALGIPCQLLLNPGGDWKWGHSSNANAWYPTVTLLPQSIEFPSTGNQ